MSVVFCLIYSLQLVNNNLNIICNIYLLFEGNLVVVDIDVQIQSEDVNINVLTIIQ